MSRKKIFLITNWLQSSSHYRKAVKRKAPASWTINKQHRPKCRANWTALVSNRLGIQNRMRPWRRHKLTRSKPSIKKTYRNRTKINRIIKTQWKMPKTSLMQEMQWNKRKWPRLKTSCWENARRRMETIPSQWGTELRVTISLCLIVPEKMPLARIRTRSLKRDLKKYSLTSSSWSESATTQSTMISTRNQIPKLPNQASCQPNNRLVGPCKHHWSKPVSTTPSSTRKSKLMVISRKSGYGL